MGQREVFLKRKDGSLIPMMKSSEEEMRTLTRVVVVKNKVVQEIKPHKLDNIYAQLEKKLTA